MDASQPFISAIATIGIPVTDQDRALEFYTETLGMEKQLDVPLPQLGGRWITIAPPGGATAIALLRAHEGVHAGVAHRRLHDRGVDVGELLHWEGVPPMFAFHDPDGNGLEIIQQA